MDAQYVYVPPCAPSRCTWQANTKTPSPHSKSPARKERPNVLPSILDAIGQTPMVRINRLAQEYGIQCKLLAKCEFLNPGGSLKDRIVPRMIEDAEKAGKILPGCTIIVPTSGNTGIGASMMSAVCGYRCIIVMPQKMSQEKEDTMRALGAEIIRTPNSAGYLSLESTFAIAQKLNREIPNSFVLDQYASASNPLAHYDTTAEEILEQCDGELDMMIIGTGTGGTLTGIGRKLKEKCPQCQIVAVDPEGSIMAHPNDLSTKKFFEVEGIGHDFVPTVCDSSVVDRWVKVSDKDTMLMARRMVKEEGLLCGGSSGTNMVAALKLAKDLKPNQKCVVLLPDGIRNYMTKFLSDQWMLERGYLESDQQLWWEDIPVSQLITGLGETVKSTTVCSEAMLAMKMSGLSAIPVLQEDGLVKGIISEETILNGILKGKCPTEMTADDFINAHHRTVKSDSKLSFVSRILQHEPLVVVVTGATQDQKETFLGTISRKDLLQFITEKNSTLNQS